MTVQFYGDEGDPEVMRLAKAICLASGKDPHERVPDNGYSSVLIPLWWKQQEFARKFLACFEAVKGGAE